MHVNYHKMTKSIHKHLFVGILGISVFLEKCKTGKKFNFAENLFPLITHEPMKVPWCFICQKNSRDAQITWSKAYVVQTTYDNAIPRESWGGNFGTPCITNGFCINRTYFGFDFAQFISNCLATTDEISQEDEP